jgi:hypothetical protein
MTLEELYGKIMASGKLKAGVAQAAEDGKLVEWTTTRGVEITPVSLTASTPPSQRFPQSLPLSPLPSSPRTPQGS